MWRSFNGSTQRKKSYVRKNEIHASLDAKEVVTSADNGERAGYHEESAAANHQNSNQNDTVAQAPAKNVESEWAMWLGVSPNGHSPTEQPDSASSPDIPPSTSQPNGSISSPAKGIMSGAASISPLPTNGESSVFPRQSLSSRYDGAGNKDFPAKSMSITPSAVPQGAAMEQPGAISDSSGVSMLPNASSCESGNISREQTAKFQSASVSENCVPPLGVGTAESLLKIKQLQEEVQRFERMHTTNLSLIEDKDAMVTSLEEKSALNREVLDLREQVARTKEDALQAVAQRKSLEFELEDLRLERESIHSERDKLSIELESARAQAHAQRTKESDSSEKAASLSIELQETKASSEILRAELIEVRNSLESIRSERDALIENRATTPKDIPDNESSLSIESESKSSQHLSLERQLKSATVKISKLTAQRTTILRQRDDAGARLSAAGGEFATLNAKLKKLSASNSEALKSLEELRCERDEALKLVEEQESVNLKSQVRINEIEANLTETQAVLRTAEDARTIAETNLIFAEDEVKKLTEKLTEREELHRLALLEERKLGVSAKTVAVAKIQSDLESNIELFLQEKDLNLEKQVHIDKISANLIETQNALQAAEETRTRTEDKLCCAEVQVKQLNESIAVKERELEESISTIQELSGREERHLETISAMKATQMEQEVKSESLREEKISALAALEQERQSSEKSKTELEQARESLVEKDGMLLNVRRGLEDSLRSIEKSLKELPVPVEADIDLSVFEDENICEISSLSDLVESCGKIQQTICKRLAEAVHKLNELGEYSEQLRTENVDARQKLDTLEHQVAGLSEEVSNAHMELLRNPEARSHEKDFVIERLEVDKGRLEVELDVVKAEVDELQKLLGRNSGREIEESIESGTYAPDEVTGLKDLTSKPRGSKLFVSKPLALSYDENCIILSRIQTSQPPQPPQE